MTEPAKSPDRRVMRVRVSFAFLSEILKCRRVEEGETIESNLPGDAEIVHVTEMPDDVMRGGGVLTMLVESHDFQACPMGDIPPEFVVVFTRRKIDARHPRA